MTPSVYNSLLELNRCAFSLPLLGLLLPFLDLFTAFP